MNRLPKNFVWWLLGAVGAWMVFRSLNSLADDAGARQRAIERETAAFGLN